MAGTSVDLEVLKDMPGYRMILKSVLKSQIQLLIEQLSEHAGEETIILTASVHDGTLSHLGSSTGKGFFDGRDEIKSQFLGYCLKSQHKKKASDSRSSPYQRPQSSISSQRRPRAQNVPVRQGSPSVNASNPPEMHRAPNHASNGQSDSSVNVKQETSEQITSKTKSGSFVAESVTFPSSLQLNHTQTSAEQLDDTNDHHGNENEYPGHESENDENTATSIKIEPITENEMELEITGVEPGKPIDDPSGWGEGHSVGASIVGDSSAANEGDQSGYIQTTGFQHESIDLTGDDDDDAALTTVPNFTPTDESCSFSVVDVMSLSSQNMVTIPSFLYQQPSTSSVDQCAYSVAQYSQSISSVDAGHPAYDMSYLDPIATAAAHDATADPTMYMPISIPINRLKHAEFNKEFYGRNKTRIVLKRHICSICGKRLLKKSDLQRHLRVHTGERPYFCPRCRQRFSQKSALTYHRKRLQH